MEDQTNKQFRTQDFYTSSVLKSAGLHLINISRSSNGKVIFIFDNPKHAEEVIRKHWNKELNVNSLDLIEAINQLKTRIYSGV